MNSNVIEGYKNKPYSIGSRWYNNYGNGFMIGTIIGEVDKFSVVFANYGIVQKGWLKKHWRRIS